MQDLYERLLAGPTGALYQDGIRSTPCNEQNFTVYHGQHCRGVEYVKDHHGAPVAWQYPALEQDATTQFIRKYGVEKVRTTQPGCAKCEGHC